MKGGIQAVVSILAALAILYLFGIFIARDGEKERNKPGSIEVVGTLVRKSYGKGSYTEFEYSFGGKSFREKSTASSVYDDRTILGEKYILRLDPEHPTQYTIVLSKPVFTSDEKVDSTLARITSVWENTSFTVKSRGVSFEYIVDGIEFSREQAIALDDANFESISEGQCYVVIYWKENPQRALFYSNSLPRNCE
jgi:hypothetical protein